MFLTDDKLNDKKKKEMKKMWKILKNLQKFTNWMEILLQEQIVFRWIMKWKFTNLTVMWDLGFKESVLLVKFHGKKMTLYIIVTFEVKLI